MLRGRRGWLMGVLRCKCKLEGAFGRRAKAYLVNARDASKYIRYMLDMNWASCRLMRSFLLLPPFI